MDRLLYIAMTGAGQTLAAQAANNHNLANASTSGFRADLTASRSMPAFYQGLPSRVYAVTERPGFDDRPGPVSTTGRDLDVALAGAGWIAVQAPDGTEAYTRAGDLQITAGGVLTTGAGHPVLGDAGPVAVPPAARVMIGDDGTVGFIPQGEQAGAPIDVDRIRLVKPDPASLYKDRDGLLRRKDGAAEPPAAEVRLVSGALEGSNVNPADALVGMISLARRFELQVKMMQSAAENGQASDRLLRLE